MLLLCRILFNLEKEYKTNTFRDMEAPIHNVRKTHDTGKFWLSDNELSSYEGFKYLYSEYDTKKYTPYFWMQEKVLKSLCLFKKQTILTIKRLSEMPSPAEYLLNYVRENDPLYHKLEESGDIVPLTKTLFLSRFHERLTFFMSWVDFCRVL